MAKQDIHGSIDAQTIYSGFARYCGAGIWATKMGACKGWVILPTTQNLVESNEMQMSIKHLETYVLE